MRNKKDMVAQCTWLMKRFLEVEAAALAEIVASRQSNHCTYDVSANAIYIKFSDSKIDRTVELITHQVLLDVDENDQPVGLEILGTNDG